MIHKSQVYILFISFIIFFTSCKSNLGSLKNIRITDRISGNHYSDHVMDQSGNSYIASFVKNKSNKDFISIIKTNSEADVIWEIGRNSEGKALAIDIALDGNIWVSGYFNNALNFGEKLIKDDGRSAGFIAAFNPSGECLSLIKIKGECLPYNIKLNAQGDILVNGTLGQEINIIGREYRRKNNTGSEFYALINKDLSCKWINEMPGLTHQIKSINNDFIIGRSFFENTFWNSDTLYTEDIFDNDGLLMRINNLGERKWWIVEGESGSVKDRFRSSDSFQDFFLTSNSDTLIAVVNISVKDNKSNNQLEKQYIYKMDLSGNVLNKHLISSSIQGNINTITSGLNNTFWITGSDASDKNEIDNQVYLHQYSNNLKLLNEVLIEHDKYFQIRSANSSSMGVSFAGHYKNKLEIGGNSVNTNNKNTLFEYKLLDM